MNSIEVKAYAKVNLTLDVVSKMEDGYHAMCMIMQSVSHCDELSIRLTDNGKVTAKSGMRYLPSDERNIAARAARLLLDHIGMKKAGAEISMKKRIPVCAGLGGGSADAAAVLRGMNEMLDAGLDRHTLEKLAGMLGSDVPFCVAGGTVLAEGRGEILTDLTPMPSCTIAICKPHFAISTPALFSKLDCGAIRCRPDTQGTIAALENGDLYGIARRLYNVFEDVLPRSAAEIPAIKNRLLDNGAIGVAMTGTGSAVFGIFSEEEKAKAAKQAFTHSQTQCYLCEPTGKLKFS